MSEPVQRPDPESSPDPHAGPGPDRDTARMDFMERCGWFKGKGIGGPVAHDGLIGYRRFGVRGEHVWRVEWSNRGTSRSEADGASLRDAVDAAMRKADAGKEAIR